jgi:hypothetical protein
MICDPLLGFPINDRALLIGANTATDCSIDCRGETEKTSELFANLFAILNS